MNIQKKLDSFSRKVMGAATEKNLRMIEEQDSQLQNELVEVRRRELQRSEKLLREAAYKAKQAKNSEVAAAAIEGKKKLLQRRNNMLDELFGGVESRLADFTRSSGYKDYLVGEVKKIAAPGIVVRLRPADAQYAEAVAKVCAAEVGGDDFLGGFIAVKGRAILDHSFRSRLAHERESFNSLMIK